MLKLLTFFKQKISMFAIFQDRNFNVTLANNFVEFLTFGLRMPLTLSMLGQKKICCQHFDFFSQKTGFDISCKLSLI